MASTQTWSETDTFTVTHARHIAAKVAADLKRMQRFYSKPTDNQIRDYESEIVELLKGGYIDTVTYGFRRHGNWIEPTLRYTARELAHKAASDDPGRISPRADVTGASFYSYLIFNSAWTALTASERATIERRLPFSRTPADEPGITGRLEQDRVYSAGGRALDRFSVKGQ